MTGRRFYASLVVLAAACAAEDVCEAPSSGCGAAPDAAAVQSFLLQASELSLAEIDLAGAVQLEGVANNEVDLLAHSLRGPLSGVRLLTLVEHTLSDGAIATTLAEAVAEHAALESLVLSSATIPTRELAAAARARASAPASLDLSGLGLQRQDAVLVAALLARGREHALRRLDVSANPLGASGGAAIADALRSAAAASLEVLDLSDCELGDSGAQAIASSLRAGGAPRLRTLVLNRNDLGDGGAEALAAALLSAAAASSLRAIHAGGNRLGDASAAALAFALTRRALPQLSSLRLGSNQLGDAALKELAAVVAALGDGALAELDLVANPVSVAAARALVTAAREARLASLSGGLIDTSTSAEHGNLALSYLKLSDADLVLVAATLPSHKPLGSLKHIWLHGNRAAHEGAVAIAQAICPRALSLTHLSLSENRISDDGGVELLSMLGSGPQRCPAMARVTELWLSNNRLGARSADQVVSLIEARAFPALRTLWLRDNRGLGEEGRRRIGAACKAAGLLCPSENVMT